MTRYTIFLEIASDGRCMAHAPDLPGCFVRAPSREEALQRLPDAIRAYHAWLRNHGEPAPSEDEIFAIDILDEIRNVGPFDPGDAAALFSPDQVPLSSEEMEDHFRLLGYTRDDLLTLARDLPDDVLDWQQSPGSFSIRHLLRHVGNAEEWYVSRLVPPEALPPKWENDQELPIFDFLEMERRTAMARLRQLTEHERTAVFHPTAWTDHPEEAWTARKVLRRFVEHELEHTGQVQEILSAWRAHLLARLATERAELMNQLVGLDEKTLTGPPVFDTWTVKDILAHIPAWDELFTGRIKLILSGREEEMTSVDLDARNAVLYAERRDWSLKQVVEACVAARAAFLETLERLSNEAFHQQRAFPWGEASVRQWTVWRALHDAAHAGHIRDWAEGRRGTTGPKEVLRAALNAQRAELLALAELVPLGERASRPLWVATMKSSIEPWTLKDVIGHLADWGWEAADALRSMAAGLAPKVDDIEDFDAWNEAHVEARRDQPWEMVCADLKAARATLLDILDGMSQNDLDQPFPTAQEPGRTVYVRVCAHLQHEREHTADLREMMCGEADEATDG